jgi:hypothetical protein
MRFKSTFELGCGNDSVSRTLIQAPQLSGHACFFEDIMAAIAHVKMAATAMSGTRPNMGESRKVAMR